MKRLSSLLLCSAACLTSAWGQTLTSIEAVEYEPNSDRWVVSNGSSMLVTADEGVTWSTFGSGGATHGNGHKGRDTISVRCGSRGALAVA